MTLGESGWHHALIALVPNLASGALAWWVSGELTVGVLVGWIVHGHMAAYYAGREGIVDKLRGIPRPDGRWRDFVYVAVLWIIHLAVLLGVR